MGIPRLGAYDAMNVLVIAILAMSPAVVGLVSEAQAQVSSDAGNQPDKFWVYVGTYTGGAGPGRSQGIYLMDFDARSGALDNPRLAGASENPSFLAIHPNRNLLFAVNELEDYQGRRSGAVSVFSIDPAEGKLTLLNQEASGGPGPCHLVIDRPGTHTLVANYGGGSIACLPIGPDGRLGPSSSFIQHKGAGADRKRQESPHAHSINLDAAGRFAMVADLGLDRIFVYRFDSAHGTLAANEPPFTKVSPRSGPRHFAFHPSGRFAYVINEMANTVKAFAYNSQGGTLQEIQTIGTLPRDFKGTSHTAEVQVHPTGKFLYGSNRGHDSIAIFTIDSSTGELSTVGFEPTQGKNPRNFAIDPTGNYLMAENGDSNSVVVFRIDPQAGALRPTGQTIHVPKPVCIKMIPRPARAGN